MNKTMTTKKSAARPRKPRDVKSATPRPPLTRQIILQTALKLVDNKGFDALSMRRLGRELNIEAMSIYHYFKNKDDLLDGLHSLMMQHIFKIMNANSSQDLSWDHQAENFAAAYRIVGRAHPHIFRIVAQRPLVMDEAIPTGHSLMEAFLRAGLDNNGAIVAYRSVTCFVAGFVLLENATLKPLYTTGDFDLEYTRGLEVLVTGIRERLSPEIRTASKQASRRSARSKSATQSRRVT